jgi:hypothetical protein
MPRGGRRWAFPASCIGGPLHDGSPRRCRRPRPKSKPWAARVWARWSRSLRNPKLLPLRGGWTRPRPAVASAQPRTKPAPRWPAQRGHRVDVVQEWLSRLGTRLSYGPARPGLSRSHAALYPLVSERSGGKHCAGTSGRGVGSPAIHAQARFCFAPTKLQSSSLSVSSRYRITARDCRGGLTFKCSGASETVRPCTARATEAQRPSRGRSRAVRFSPAGGVSRSRSMSVRCSSVITALSRLRIKARPPRLPR